MKTDNELKIKCPECGQDYLVENTADIFDMDVICQNCNTQFPIKDNLIEEDFSEKNNLVTDHSFDVADKTIPPRRMPDMDVSERTMPGFRERRADGRFMVGDLIMGRYKVLAELGQGGMGVVYKCFDETAGIEIALKALPPELSHNTLEMEDIKENFQLIHNLHHPNIASSNNLEKDNANGNYYLIMECVDGEDLRRWIKRKRRDGGITLEIVIPIIRQIAKALDYAHKEMIIHRDIKPGNIMIMPDGTIKVLDFGLAAQIHTSMTRVSMAYHGTSGTGPYMAPEQWRGRAQGPAADQYALAIMTYEMLAGHLPFESSEAEILRVAVLNENPEPISDFPESTSKAIFRSMSKEPKERFETCMDFAVALGGMTETTATPVVKKETLIPSSEKNKRLLVRAELFLEEKNWDKAKEYCNKILDEDPENARAYLIQFLYNHHLEKTANIVYLKENPRSDLNFLRACKFANSEFRIFLDQIIYEWETYSNYIILKNNLSNIISKMLNKHILIQQMSLCEKIIKYKDVSWIKEQIQHKLDLYDKNLQTLIGAFKEKNNFIIFFSDIVYIDMVYIQSGICDVSFGKRLNHFFLLPPKRILKSDFWLCKTPITQAQWKSVMDNNPSKWNGDELPVEQVSWHDAMEFCERLNKTGLAPKGWCFSLPTEVQWEYAARGGNKSTGYEYSGSDDINYIAWYDYNSGEQTHEVGTKLPNELGLFDMSGNVWEWCLDAWHDQENHIVRGGGWNNAARFCHTWSSSNDGASVRRSTLGFRLALVPDDTKKQQGHRLSQCGCDTASSVFFSRSTEKNHTLP